MRDTDNVIRSLHVTEKGSRLAAAENKYLFKVDPRANKLEIKRAVEQMFKVTVVKVNTMNVLGKMRRERTPHYGRRSNWKRAVVTLKAGEKIELT